MMPRSSRWLMWTPPLPRARTLTDSGSITFTDLDLTDTPTATEVTKSVTTALTLTIAQQNAIEDAFTISPDALNTNNGTINWDYTITEGELDFLAAGETVTVVYTITVDDANGGTDTQDVTVTITGANDTPVIAVVDVDATITEGGTLTDSGSITFTDLDLTDTPTATEVTKSVTTALTLTAAQQTAIEDAFTISPDAVNTNNGTINWDYTITEAELDFLAAGETVTVVYTITVDDGNGGTDTQDVTVSITGSNDAPVIAVVDVAGAITEGSTLTDAGSITFTDLDLTDTPTATEVTKSVTTALTLTAAQQTAIEDAFTISPDALNANNGTINWDYTITEAELDFLAAGETVTVVYTITVDDANGGTDTQDVTVVITGSNDVPTASNLNTAEAYTEDTLIDLTDIVTADIDTETVTVTLTLSDVAAGALSTGTSGLVTSTFAAGVWTASGVIADVNTLLAGVIFTPALNYNSNFTIATSVDDGIDPPVTGVKTVTGTAVNDAPVNNTPSSQATSKNVSVVFSSGNGNAITIGDVDAGANLMQITLNASNGLITLGSIPAGLSFSTGDGTADASMTFTGNLVDINAALEGLTYDPATNFTGVTSLEIISNDQGSFGTGGAQSNTSTVIINVDASLKLLWLSTTGDENSSDAPGLSSWGKGEVLEFSDPNLAFDPGTTSGTLSSGLDLTAFSTDSSTNINAVHYVADTVVVGGDTFPSITLLEGDVLISTKDTENLTSTNSLTVKKEDVFVFRPDVAGDYSSGTFIMLLDNPVGKEIRAISLVEQDTWVGDTTVQKGSFLFATSDGATDNQIRVYRADDVGSGTTSGTDQILLDGDDANVGNFNDKIFGLELIEQNTEIGGVSLHAGNILVTLDSNATVGSNDLSVSHHDIFVFDVTKTTLVAGAGNGAATATLLFDGSDVNFDSGDEHLDAISIVLSNHAPDLDNSGDMTLTAVLEDDTNPPGDTIASIIASDGGDPITDVDADANEGFAVIGADDTNGEWQYDANANGTWLAFGAVTNSNAVLLSDAALIRFVPDANYFGSAGNITFRAWDQTTGNNGATGVDVSTNGGVTAYSSNIETATVAVTPVNDVPVTAVVDVTGVINEGGTLSDAGSITFTDIDLADTPTATEVTKSVTTALTLTAAQQTAIEDAFTISPDAGNTNNGTINWDYTITEAELDFLAAGETVTVVYTITVDDGNGGTDTQDVTVTITGANDAPVIAVGRCHRRHHRRVHTE